MACPTCRGAASVLLTCLLLLPAAPAFTHSLSSESVRDAYFLGQRNDNRTADFLDEYKRTFPMPDSGLYVSEVELFTPFAEAVDLSRQRTFSYSAQQAEEEYRRRGSVVRLRVRVFFTDTYSQNTYAQSASTGGPSVDSDDAQHAPDSGSFQIFLRQKGRIIQPMATPGIPVYRGYTEGDGYYGFEVILHYRARNISSDDADVLISTPEGQHVVTTFDLSSLR